MNIGYSNTAKLLKSDLSRKPKALSLDNSIKAALVVSALAKAKSAVKTKGKYGA